jgi:SHS2 domain-containing protein
MQGFYEIEHKADIGLEIFGETLEQLFIQAVYGFYSILLPDINLQKLNPHGKAYHLKINED